MFPKRQLLVLNGDNLIEFVYKKNLDILVTFLPLQKSTRRSFEARKVSQTPKYYSETNFSYRKKPYGSMKTFPCFKNTTYEFCMKNDKGREHPKIEASTEIYLQKLFRPMVKKLFRMTGIRLGLSISA